MTGESIPTHLTSFSLSTEGDEEREQINPTFPSQLCAGPFSVRLVPMAATSSSSPPLSTSTVNLTALPEQDPKLDLLKEMRGHEVAISELNSIRDNRAVYQKTGNIFFRKNVKLAIAAEQKHLDLAKAQLEKLNAPK